MYSNFSSKEDIVALQILAEFVFNLLDFTERITMRQLTVSLRAIGNSDWWWWKAPIFVRYILFCKEWCVYCSYTHRLSKRKRNWHFVCVPLWLCFVKLKTNILGQSHLLFAALVCFHNKTRTGLRTTCFLQSRGVIPILNNNCYEFTIRRHWIAERSYSYGLSLRYWD